MRHFFKPPNDSGAQGSNTWVSEMFEADRYSHEKEDKVIVPADASEWEASLGLPSSPHTKLNFWRQVTGEFQNQSKDSQL